MTNENVGTINALLDEEKSDIDEFADYLRALNEGHAWAIKKRIVNLNSKKGKDDILLNPDWIKRDGIKGHDLQEMLAEMFNNYFQIWKEKNNIHNDMEIEVKNKGSLPSPFIIVLKDEDEEGDKKIVSNFCIRNRVYGNPFLNNRNRSRLNQSKNVTQMDDDELKKIESKITKIQKEIDKPMSQYRGWKNRISYLRHGKNGIKKLLSETKEELEIKRSLIMKDIESNGLSEKETEKREAEQKKLLNIVKPFFEDHNFEHTEENHKIY